jgi:curved DNA-binding protein CbpA
MKNPYEELEVSKDFTIKELKSKFRKLAKKHHPDLKGTSSKFINLKKSYNILINPEKRKYFDETGLFFDEMEDNKIRSNAKENLFKLIEQIIYNPDIINHYKNMDLITIINKAINDNKNNIVLSIKKISKEYKTAKKILNRLEYKGTSNNFIEVMIENSIKHREDIIKNMSNSIKVFDLMLDIIKEYNYNFEEIISYYSTNNFTNINTTTS